MGYFVTYLIYVAVVARAIGWNADTSKIPTSLWILLAVYGLVLISQQPLTRRYTSYPRIYIVLQSALAIAMLYRNPTLDFIPLLYLPLCFQAVQFFHDMVGFTWIGILILSMAGTLLFGMDTEAGLTMMLVGGGSAILMGSFAHLINRTEQRQQENQGLLKDLQVAYSQLKDSATQAEELAAASERHRLVRELHDSLTQTLFSMNLAVQSAQLALGEDPLQAEEHLVRLQNLSHSAAGEVQALTGQTPLSSLTQGRLVAALNQLAEERLAQDGLQVTIEVDGQRSLAGPVEMTLYRIVQEALNNITRHAGVRQAMVRLNLESPRASLEIKDEGCGFDVGSLKEFSGFGLPGMVGRAGEIGWDLEINSHPGQGTLIRVEERAA